MKEFDITKIKKVVEVDLKQFSAYVKKGYVLLHVCSESEKTLEGDTVTRVMYIMGHE